MILTKTVTIIDDATSISALLVKPLTATAQQPLSPSVVAIWERAGFPEQHAHTYVLLIDLNSSEAHWDSYEWSERSGRTMRLAHRTLIEDWNAVEDGGTLDVRTTSIFNYEKMLRLVD